MKLTPIVVLALAALVAAEEIPLRPAIIIEPPESPAAPEVVTSRSGQFRISGGDGSSRATVAILVEETNDDLIKLTGETERWKIPVNVTLHGKPGDPLPPRTAAMELLSSEAGYHLRLRVHLSRGVERERFRRATLTALLYERGLRGLPASESDSPLHVPPWLAEGLLEAHDWHARSSDRRLYEVLYKRGGLYTLDQLFAIDEARLEAMDGAMRAAFRVSSGSLVMALLEQPQGQEAFRAFLRDVPPYAGEMPVLLRKHFPELNLSETSLAKWWALQMANKGTPDLGEILTIAQTEAALGEALRFHLKSPEGSISETPLGSALPVLPPAELSAAVRPAQDALVRLSYRCFPSYRPLLVDYQAILGDVALGKSADLGPRLSALDETRTIMIAKAHLARDFLDWFEITRARETSGAFDDFLRLKDQLKYNPPRRNDDLSRYLDRMDRVFHRDTGDSVPSTALGPNLILPP